MEYFCVCGHNILKGDPESHIDFGLICEGWGLYGYKSFIWLWLGRPLN